MSSPENDIEIEIAIEITIVADRRSSMSRFVSPNGSLACILVVALLFTGMSCAHKSKDEPAPATRPTKDPIHFTEDWNKFTSAYDELWTSIHASPNWSTKSPSLARHVRGRAALATHRLEEMRGYVGTGRITDATLDLAKLRVLRVAKLNVAEKPSLLRDEWMEKDEALAAWQAETSYRQLTESRAALTRYQGDGIRNAWLDTHVIPDDLAAARTVADLDFADTADWHDTPVSATDFTAVVADAHQLIGREPTPSSAFLSTTSSSPSMAISTPTSSSSSRRTPKFQPSSPPVRR